MQPQEPTEHNRTQFQIDRIAFFSDAVIAIAITLMVLEIKIPEFGKSTSFIQVFQKYTQSMLLHFISLIFGFAIIGGLWMRHHELFEHITNYNKKLIRINLYFLFTVMLLPISISFLFTENEPPQLQISTYFINLFLCSLSYSLMLLLIFHKKNNFSSLGSKKAVNKITMPAYISTLVLFAVVILLLMNVEWFYVPLILYSLTNFCIKTVRNIKAAKLKRSLTENQ